MKFSLVIPCYNEAANLPLLLDRCKELTRHGDVEVSWLITVRRTIAPRCSWVCFHGTPVAEVFVLKRMRGTDLVFLLDSGQHMEKF